MTASPCPPHASDPTLRRRLGRVFSLIGLVSAIGWAAACGSSPRAEDACNQIESARCHKLASSTCGGLAGDPDGASCARFYVVQCERGIADDAAQPVGPQLANCLKAIAASCDVARAPETFIECGFLATSSPPEAGLDTGSDAADSGETAGDGGTDAPTDAASDAAEAAPDTATAPDIATAPDVIDASEVANDTGAPPDADDGG